MIVAIDYLAKSLAVKRMEQRFRAMGLWVSLSALPYRSNCRGARGTQEQQARHNIEIYNDIHQTIIQDCSATANPFVTNHALLNLPQPLPSNQDQRLFFPFRSATTAGSQYSHNATTPSQAMTVAQIPTSPTQAPLIAQLRGHSSWAKCRTVTERFSSTEVRKGRL